MTQRYYAHSLPEKSEDRWHLLEDHLKEVAETAREFANSFGAGDWAYLAGLWHDVGKYSGKFQQKLAAENGENAHIEKSSRRVDHSTAGAQHAFDFLGEKGKLLAYVIAGHHSGLPDGKSNEASCLINRLKKVLHDWSACPQWIINNKRINTLPFAPVKDRFGFQLSFFVRMIFSCLVDADFLNTEKFMDSQRFARCRAYPSLGVLNKKLEAYIKELKARDPSKPINKHREEILKNCLARAGDPQGLFSLTVPTGGGKTFSSLAFAMKHAIKHDLKRIIYVIPYTNIIEQTAGEFRKCLGEDVVLEHHSNFEPKGEDYLSRLASENWDAPLVVTTNVQFFESLFANRSSRCRRIHNIMESVVILDEVQMLPVPLLKACLEAIKELSEAYRTTIVLCSATQPALSATEDFRDGLEGVREIVPDPKQLYNSFKRIHTEVLQKLSGDELADRLKALNQVLCIVNTRKHARLIFERISKKVRCYHLSGLMCPAHRTYVLANIKLALEKKRCCRVVSTQLIEAGVDIDFPVVFRSAAGIDSIAQAAGRCNREGKLSEGGKVFIFSPENGLPRGYFRQNAETAEIIMRRHEEPLSLEAVKEYFQNLYWMNEKSLDEYHILDDLAEGIKRGDFPFKSVSQKFKLIKNNMWPIITPWDPEAKEVEVIKELRYSKYPASFARKVQRFTIQIPLPILASLQAAGSVECIRDQYYVLVNRDLYHDDLGLCFDDPTFHEAKNLMV